MKNVVSEEQNVKGIVAKLQSGDADAGFVYVTDAKAAAGALTQIPIPADASPTATYPIAVVSKSDAKELAPAMDRLRPVGCRSDDPEGRRLR